MFWLVIAAHTQALAQVADGGSALPGTVQEGIFRLAPADNRRVFGVSSYLDGTILPRMDLAEGAFIVADTSTILGVTRAAADGCWTLPPDDWVGTACSLPLDLGASQVGAGYSWRYGGLFYGATFTTATVGETTVDRALWSGVITPGMALVTPYLAPLVVGPTAALAGVDEGRFGSGMEYVIGGRLTLPVGDDTLSAHAGYMASANHQGAFTSLTERQLRAMLTLALAEQGVPYLLAGLSRSPFLFRGVDAIGEWPMLTSMFVRRVGLPQPLGIGDDATTTTGDEQSIPFWTGHVEQYNIGPIDVRAAISWRPQTRVHALLVTWHTANFNPDHDDTDDWESIDEWEAWSVGVTAGMVSVPPAYYLAAPGGPSLHLEAALRAPRGGGLAVTLNHPDTLTAFPYAHNSVHITGKVRL